MQKISTVEDAVNLIIKTCDKSKITDGYHTFNELYDHRNILFISLCQHIHERFTEVVTSVSEVSPVWRSKRHSTDVEIAGWFLLGINHEPGKQITYHLPSSLWTKCDFAKTLEKAPEYDGHTSSDVLTRIDSLL